MLMSSSKQKYEQKSSQTSTGKTGVILANEFIWTINYEQKCPQTCSSKTGVVYVYEFI